MNKYKWKIPKYPVDAQDAGDFIDSLIKDSGGKVTPKQIVDASREETDTLHPCFEWDNSKAAEKYREDQASGILQNLVLVEVEQVVITPDIQKVDLDSIKLTEPSVRAYTNIKVDKNDKRVFMPTVDVLSQEELKKITLEDAQRDIRMFVNKYKGLVDLAGILEDILSELRTT